MSTVPERSDNAEGAAADPHVPRLTIGEVLATLRDKFPDVTISKIRYLESEDLVHPQRTASGYRKFSAADVDRLRYVLSAQRDHYLPLRVIKEHLDAVDGREPLPNGAPDGRAGDSAGGDSAVGEGAVGEGAVGDRDPDGSSPPDGDGNGASSGLDPAGSRPLTATEFARAAGMGEAQLADCVQFGLLAVDDQGRHPVADLPAARAAAGLARHGIEPRHLRGYRNGAEREAGLIEQVVAPVLRARSHDARSRATSQLQELATLSTQLHSALLEARLRELLRP